MKNLIKLLLSLSIFLGFHLIFPNQTFAQPCGSYWGFVANSCGDPSLPGGTCHDAETSSDLCPFVLCDLPGVCCETQADCDALLPSPTPGGPTPPPLLCDNNLTCSERWWDVGGNQWVCGYSLDNCISPYVMCNPGFTYTCCQSLALCPTPTPLPPPPVGCDDYPVTCVTECTVDCTRDAYNCCLEIEPFQTSECPCPPAWMGTTNYDCIQYPILRTGIGCIPTHPLFFIVQIRNIITALGGGIALLLMIVGSFFILTSQGQPERVKRGKEIFVGGITGLLLVIFANLVLNLITKDILGLF